MVQSTILIIIGMYTIYNSNKDWLTLFIGFILLSIGVIFGEILEERTLGRIKELEKKVEKDCKDKFAWDYDGYS